MDASATGVVTRLKTWVAHPVTNPMDFMTVVLTTVLIVSVAVLWSRILAQITE